MREHNTKTATMTPEKYTLHKSEENRNHKEIKGNNENKIIQEVEQNRTIK